MTNLERIQRLNDLERNGKVNWILGSSKEIIIDHLVGKEHVTIAPHTDGLRIEYYEKGLDKSIPIAEVIVFDREKHTYSEEAFGCCGIGYVAKNLREILPFAVDSYKRYIPKAAFKDDETLETFDAVIQALENKSK